jgi:hypothetical protein
VLDLRERQRKSAWFRRYGDADALRSDAVGRERAELEALARRCARSFGLQRREADRRQQRRRRVFADHWGQKGEQAEAEAAKELSVRHLERGVADAEAAGAAELRLISRNERLASTPMAARQAATHRRFCCVRRQMNRVTCRLAAPVIRGEVIGIGAHFRSSGCVYIRKSPFAEARALAPYCQHRHFRGALNSSRPI